MGLALSRRNKTTAFYRQSSIEEAAKAEAMEQIMQMLEQSDSKKMRAVEALKSVLTHVSGVKLKTIDVDAQQIESVIEIVAQIEVYGRAHTLACMLVSSDQPQQTRESILEFCGRALTGVKSATPVLIAPRLSSDLQKLGRETNAGVLDLEGNARIEVGEAFIACHKMSRLDAQLSRSETQQQSRPDTPAKPPRVHAVKRSAHAGAAA
jgi:hypothetical protein